MTLMTSASRSDHFRASRIVTAMAAMALLGLLAALPVRLEAQCTLSGSPISFEPNPPGVSRETAPYLGAGYSSNLALYQNGGSGPYRLLMQESYGYSVLDLSNPVNPTALYYHDVRLPVGGPNSVPHHGDGQNNIATIAVSPDGQRVAFSTTGPALPLQTVVGSPDGVNGFTLWGDFFPDRAFSTLIQHIGSRYIAYDFSQGATASDITTLPASSLQFNNLSGGTEMTTWPGGYLASLAGNYILYLSDGAIQVIDASRPGPIGSITAAYPKTTITSADFGGRTIASYSAAVDPADATKLWVLVELNAKAGENSPSYGLLSVTSSLAKVSAGPIWRVKSQPGDVWWPNPGASSALIPSNGSLFVLMWAQRAAPSLLFELYSTTVAAWGAVNSSAPPGVFDIPTAFYSNFSPGSPMRGFSADNSIYAYLPTGMSAYMIPMSCVSQNTPAVASMSVVNQAGAPLNNGDTVFLGDQITITPSVNPSPASQPLTALSLLGTAQTFAVLGASTVTNTVRSVLTGDLGVYPGSAITGFPPGIVNGTTHAGDAAALAAQNAVTTAYNALAGQVCPALNNLTGQNLGGKTLTPGVYCFSSSAQLTGTLTLNAQGSASAVFVFQIGSTLTTASNSVVQVINGGSDCNVFWQVGSSATLGTSTRFAGSILALTSITLNTSASVSGRVLARNGAVTLDTNIVTVCLAALGWNFDFDFHAGTAFDDNGPGAFPRLKAPDNAAVGSPSSPPATFTVVGPCDYQAGGDPLSGHLCWNSVTTNGASGGPDFAAAPAAGSTTPLTFAFEANNALGSAGASLFTLKWKVPAAKLQSTQVLSAQPLVSGSDGHPTATGFKWYFGATPTALAQAAGCTGPTCVPTLDTRGTYYYWLTASYANGYVTPGYAGTAAMGTYTVTDFAPAFTVNGATSGPITAITNQSLTVLNSSQRGAGISANYQYNLCLSPCAPPLDNNYQVWPAPAMTDPPSSGSPPKSATIPVPATLGSYALKIKVNYTGGTTYWPDPAGAVSFPLNVVDVSPLGVNVTVSPATAAAGQNVTFSCNATGGLAPYSYEWRSPTWIVGTQQTYQTTSPVAGTVQALCTVTDSQAPPQTSNDSATAHFTGGSVSVSVSISANPNPTTVNNTVYFTCSASGGNGGPFSYAWSGNAVSGTGPNVSQTFTSAGNYNAICTATDTAGGGSGVNSTTVVVSGGGSGGSLSVNVSVSPNPGTVNQPVTFACNVSGGSAPYLYEWRSPSTSSWVLGRSQTFQTNSPTPTSVQAGCTATDSAGASSGNAATVTINAAAPPAATCVDVDFRIVDDATQLPIPISGNLGQYYFSVQTGQRLRFIASGSTQASWTSVAWSFGDGGSGSGNPSFVYAYPASGTFTATATVDGNSGCTKSYQFIVAGPSGLFTARYADNSKFSSTQVESGKDVSFLATDTADSYSYAWNFGDGKTATGKNPTHAFTINGSTNVTFTTTLTVTIGSQNWPTSQTFTVIPPPEPPKWFVAGLANTQGAVSGTVWQSDLTILNPHPTLSGTYSLAFLDGSKNPVAPKDLVWQTITLPAQQSTSWSNVVGTFFGKPLGSYGAVIVRGDVAPVAPTITSRTYNNGDPVKGTFGLSVPAVQATSGVSQQSSAAQQLLIGLRDDGSADTNTGAYTNIGLVNLISTDVSHAHLTFFDAAGANLGVLQVDVPPYGVAQRNKPLTKPLGPDGLGLSALALYRVRVTVDPGGAVYPYATVIDQASTDPIVVTPTEVPSNAYRIPGIVRSTGAKGEQWRSRVTISNPSGGGARKVHMVFSYVSCDASGCVSLVIPGDVTMNPGQTQSWDDFAKVWLAVKGHIFVDDATKYQDSFLDVSPGDSNSDPLVVLGETYNETSNGHIGLQIPGYTLLDGASRTGAYKRLALTGLASTTAYRTNLALFVVAGTPGKWVNVHVYSPQGTKLRDVPVPVNDFSPVNNETLFGGLSGDLSGLSIVVDNIDDGVTVGGYATIIDNTSGDATFVKAQPVP
jgi:PKD repeat protein